jgi:hypothetical protein
MYSHAVLAASIFRDRFVGLCIAYAKRWLNKLTTKLPDTSGIWNLTSSSLLVVMTVGQIGLAPWAGSETRIGAPRGGIDSEIIAAVTAQGLKYATTCASNTRAGPSSAKTTKLRAGAVEAARCHPYILEWRAPLPTRSRSYRSTRWGA